MLIPVLQGEKNKTKQNTVMCIYIVISSPTCDSSYRIHTTQIVCTSDHSCMQVPTVICFSLCLAFSKLLHTQASQMDQSTG